MKSIIFGRLWSKEKGRGTRDGGRQLTVSLLPISILDSRWSSGVETIQFIVTKRQRDGETRRLGDKEKIFNLSSLD